MRKYTQIIKIVLALLIFGAFSFAVACEPPIDFKIINKTDVNLNIYYSDSYAGEIAPDKFVIVHTLATFDRYPFIARSASGDVIYAVNITRNDIRGKKIYEVVIPPSTK